MKWILILFLLYPGLSWAEIYTWVDENGKTRFSDNPPQNGNAKAVKLKSTNAAQAVKVKKPKPQYELPVPLPEPEAPADAEQKLAALCAKVEEEYSKLTTIDHTATTMSAYVIKDGSKTISRREQNRRAEAMRKEANSRGCNIAPTENMKL